MANTKSAKKATRVSARRTEINKNRVSRMRTFVRKVEEAIASGNQAEAFGRVIRKRQKPFWGVEDAIQNMKILDALFRSEKSRKWEKP